MTEIKNINIDPDRLPEHVAITMDGNGRWAKRHGNVRLFGHQNGVSTVNEIVTAAAELGIKYLTLYTFSTENWNRPQDEVSGLMNLLISASEKNLEKLIRNNVKLLTIGDFESLPQKVRTSLQNVIEKTKNNTGLTLILAISYSSRWEITEMVKSIAQQCVDGKINPSAITNETIQDNLSTRGIPDPELLIRTSGEYRISNFLLWQIAYTELYFTDTLWPDFTKEEFYKAIENYQSRTRRFGKVDNQL
ncbi:MAG: isoprenyl transferase [Bacteroidales bacterium]|nr:isoprenyl transferase [Bacteroidales bacterium]